MTHTRAGLMTRNQMCREESGLKSTRWLNAWKDKGKLILHVLTERRPDVLKRPKKFSLKIYCSTYIFHIRCFAPSSPYHRCRQNLNRNHCGLPKQQSKKSKKMCRNGRNYELPSCLQKVTRVKGRWMWQHSSFCVLVLCMHLWFLQWLYLHVIEQ